VAQKVTLKVSAAASAYVRPETAKEEKLKAARGEIPFSEADFGMVLFLLCRDQDTDVRTSALRSLQDMPDSILFQLASGPDTHPVLLDMLARYHFANVKLAEAILAHPGLDMRTRHFLAEKMETATSVRLSETGSEDSEGDDDVDADADADAEADEIVPEGGDDEEAEAEGFSKYKLLQNMPINEKIRMAMVGDKEWRSLLIKETNKLVSTAVIKNPRITEPEILSIAKSAELNEEVIRLVSMNKEWIKLYPVRKALVENSKTPLPRALRFLSTLNDKDLASLAKSKNISSVLARQAQRLILNKKKS
jgi:hypothetical protein